MAMPSPAYETFPTGRMTNQHLHLDYDPEKPPVSPTGTGCLSNDDSADSVAEPERWNSTRINAYRYYVTNVSFLIMGMNDGCLGALLPYIETYYSIDYTTVSTLFVVPLAGYIVAALINNWIHYTVGQRGAAFIGPITRLLAYLPMALHPSFPVLPCVMMFTGFGNGVQDSAYNAWIGNMHHANELLGFLHGSYGVGATISPLIASAMITEANLEWYTFFYIMIGLTFVEFVIGTTAFWGATGDEYKRRMHSQQGKSRVTTLMAVKEPVTWIVAIFLLGYVAAEVSLGGWIVTFMLRVRHAKPFLAGLTVTLFWLGLTLGRVVLGFVTERIGEKLAITIYLALSILLELLYWLVPDFVASVIFVMLLGFFLGPLFPAAIVAATKLLPTDYHISALGFASAVGGGGAAIGPFAVGAIAQQTGVQVLQPIVLGILVFIIAVWTLLPGGFRKGGLEMAREQNLKPGGDLREIWSWIRMKAARAGRPRALP